MSTSSIVIVDYDPQWPKLFQESQAPARAPSEMAAAIEHIGSTAESASLYGQLKCSLAAQYSHDCERYNLAKTAFVSDILRRSLPSVTCDQELFRKYDSELSVGIGLRGYASNLMESNALQPQRATFLTHTGFLDVW